MKYHVITPFSRFQNLMCLAEMLKPLNVDWHLLLDDTLPIKMAFQDPWVHAYYYPVVQPFWEMWRVSINRFVKTEKIDPDARYLILNDDDAYEPDFFSKLDQHSGEVVLASMKRGHSIPNKAAPIHAHGTHTLIAAPENMRQGHVGAEQLVLSGRLFAQVELQQDQNADGILIEKMRDTQAVDFAPEAYVWFNYYEPGRWNK